MNILNARFLLAIALTCSTCTFGMDVMDVVLGTTSDDDDSAPIISTCRMPNLYTSDLRQHIDGKLYATLDPHSGQRSHSACRLPTNLSVVKTRLVVSKTDRSFGFWNIDSTESLLNKQPQLTSKQVDTLIKSSGNTVIVDESNNRLIKINNITHIEKSLASQIRAANNWMNENSNAVRVIEQLSFHNILLANALEELNNAHQKCEEKIKEKDNLLEQYREQLKQANQKNTDLSDHQLKENLKLFEEKKAFETRIDELTYYKKAYTMFLRATTLAIGSYLVYLLACKITK